MTMHLEGEGCHLYYRQGLRTEGSHMISLSHFHPTALIYGPFFEGAVGWRRKDHSLRSLPETLCNKPAPAI